MEDADGQILTQPGLGRPDLTGYRVNRGRVAGYLPLRLPNRGGGFSATSQCEGHRERTEGIAS